MITISADISLYKGDTGIGRHATLSNSCDEIDISDAEVTFEMGNHVLYPKKLDGGRLLLTFDEVHTEKTGWFNCCFKVKYADGRVETYPSAEQPKIKIHIKEC